MILDHRTAGIAGAGSQAVPRALPGGIDQANLQGARRAGRDQVGGTNNAAALSVTAHGHADAGDGELVAGREGKLRDAERGCGLPSCGRCKLQQRHVGSGAMGQHCLHLKAGMGGHAPHIAQLRLPFGVIFHDLVVGAGLHAVRHGQYQARRVQAAGAEIAARADDGDDGTADALGRGRRAADDRSGWT